MKKQLTFLSILFIVTITLISFIKFSKQEKKIASTSLKLDSARENSIRQIKNIFLPEGFQRNTVALNSFAAWLQNIQLRKDNIVYYYNGKPIERQDLHYAVLDVSTGNKDLQQCADAVMRLKSEYYFFNKNFDSISFSSGNKNYNFKKYATVKNSFSHDCLMRFLENVFINCGTYTIDEMTTQIDINAMQIGDVFVKAGAPGHTMIVVDMAYNPKTNKEIYMLAQGYMPAQDMHIVINPMNEKLSPWYEINNDEIITTPGFIFNKYQLKRWK